MQAIPNEVGFHASDRLSSRRYLAPLVVLDRENLRRDNGFALGNVIYDTGVISFGDKTLSEAVIYGTGSSKLVDVAVLNIDSNGTGQVYPSLLAEFKLLNAASVGPLNVLVDGNLVLANVPFAGVSNYQITTAGSHNIAVQAAATRSGVM